MSVGRVLCLMSSGSALPYIGREDALPCAGREGALPSGRWPPSLHIAFCRYRGERLHLEISAHAVRDESPNAIGN